MLTWLFAPVKLVGWLSVKRQKVEMNQLLSVTQWEARTRWYKVQLILLLPDLLPETSSEVSQLRALDLVVHDNNSEYNINIKSLEVSLLPQKGFTHCQQKALSTFPHSFDVFVGLLFILHFVYYTFHHVGKLSFYQLLCTTFDLWTSNFPICLTLPHQVLFDWKTCYPVY